MNITAYVVPTVVAVTPKGAVVELRSLGAAAVFYWDLEAIAGGGEPSYPSSCSGKVHQGMNVHLISTYILIGFGFVLVFWGGRCEGWGFYLFWPVLQICWGSELCISQGWQKTWHFSKVSMSRKREVPDLPLLMPVLQPQAARKGCWQ